MITLSDRDGSGTDRQLRGVRQVQPLQLLNPCPCPCTVTQQILRVVIIRQAGQRSMIGHTTPGRCFKINGSVCLNCQHVAITFTRRRDNADGSGAGAGQNITDRHRADIRLDAASFVGQRAGCDIAGGVSVSAGRNPGLGECIIDPR